MKRLTVVRHGHAKIQDAPVTDFERPLSRRGKAEVKATALRLLKLALIPDLLLTSPARRTAETAQILVRELQIPQRHMRQDEALYLAVPEVLLRIIHATGVRIEHLMIVGHNPGVSELANALAPQAALGELTTAAACTMEFDAATWPNISAGSAKNTRREKRSPRLFGLLK